ncbi:MAG: hypothetical protein M3P18_06165, partial [Actinomycetota bacterium]|nr:hypothetical protein [Actinomycetota bacterium]
THPDPHPVTSLSGDETSATWAPCSCAIAFDSNETGNTGIYILKLDGTSQPRLRTPASDNYFDPAWRPRTG